MGDGEYSPEEMKKILENLGVDPVKEQESIKVAQERLQQGFKKSAGKGSDPKADSGPRKY